MDIQILQQADKASIKLPPRFDLVATGMFRQTYAKVLADGAVTMIEIDFADVQYIDSTALGSLLLLRDRADKSARSVTLANCQPRVMKILTEANFHRIFSTS